MITTLLQFHQQPPQAPTGPFPGRIPVKATSSNRIYRVGLKPDICQCESFKYNRDCIHLNKARLMFQTRLNEYYQARFERPGNAFWHSFESLMAHYTWQLKPNVEVDYLAILFLNILYNEQEATADSLHYITNNQFSSDPRIIGVVVSILQRKGIIQKVGYVPSARKVCHNRMIAVWKLTGKGLGIFENGGFQ